LCDEYALDAEEKRMRKESLVKKLDQAKSACHLYLSIR